MLSRVIASGREVLTRVLVEGDKVLIPEMTQTDVSVSDISNCLEHDIYNENLWYESLHSSFFRIIAFRMVNSLRMQATRATFLTFPAVMSRV